MENEVATFDLYDTLTTIFKKIRPNENPKAVVYSVDAGEPTDYNLVFHAGEIVKGEVIGEPITVILSKEWIIDYLIEISKQRQEKPKRRPRSRKPKAQDVT